MVQYLVFEFVERTLLEDLDCNPTGLPRETVACNMVQLLRAMEYLHSCQVSWAAADVSAT